MSIRKLVASSAIPPELINQSPATGLVQFAAGRIRNYQEPFNITEQQGRLINYPQLFTEPALEMQINGMLSGQSHNIIPPWLHRLKNEQQCGSIGPDSKLLQSWAMVQQVSAETNYNNAGSHSCSNAGIIGYGGAGAGHEKSAEEKWLQIDNGKIINYEEMKVQMMRNGRAMQMVMEAAGLQELETGAGCPGGRMIGNGQGAGHIRCPGVHMIKNGQAERNGYPGGHIIGNGKAGPNGCLGGHINGNGQAGLTGHVMQSCPATRKRKRGSESVISSDNNINTNKNKNRVISNNINVESQRMNHITVERNRRKQMNHHLAVIRSLMPSSYVQRGDQASIIGGAIEFVKELEHVVHSLRLEKQKKEIAHTIAIFEEDNHKLNELYDKNNDHQQQSNSSNISDAETPRECSNTNHAIPLDSSSSSSSPTSSISTTSNDHGQPNVEVKFFGSNALIKVLAPKAPHQLFHVLSRFHNLKMNIMHLNISTMDHIVLYIFNVKVDAQCHDNDMNHISSLIKSIFNYGV